MPGKLIEYGELEGRVAMEVNVDGLNLDEEGELLRTLLPRRVPGAAAVILTGRVPWGAHLLDRQLLLLQSDVRTEGLEVWAMRAVTATQWSAAPLWWVLDVSAMLKQSFAQGIISEIDALPFVPRPTELVALDPNPDAVHHTVLDELGTRLDAGANWLYVRRDELEQWEHAREQASRASTPWGVRALYTGELG